MSTGSGLSTRALAKAYGGHRVLEGIDLDVPAGSLTAILGPSGCGKTTFLRLVAGFERPDGGQVVIGGEPVFGAGVVVPPERRRVGYVPQEGALFPHLSVAANIGFGLPRSARQGPRVGELLELVGMAGLGGRMPHQLSGGQQQRVALARALAPAPSLVLLDEPFTSLDAGLRATVRADVREVLVATGATAVLVTHDQSEALSMADQVAVLRGGVLVQTAPPATVYGAPVDVALAEFLGEAVLLPGTVEAGLASCALGRLVVEAGPREGPVTVLIRPEQIVLGIPGGTAARVVGTTYYGHDASIELELDGDGSAASESGLARLTARTSGSATPPNGSRVTLSVSGSVRTYPPASRHQ